LKLSYLKIFLCLLVLGGSRAYGQDFSLSIPIVGLYNTGVSTSVSDGVTVLGQVLPGGSVDPNYTLDGGHAFVTLTNVWPYWSASPTAAYISPVANLDSLPGGSGVSIAPGTYTYTTQFNLPTGLAYSGGVTGTASADDYVTAVLLNGVNIQQSPVSGSVGFSNSSGVGAGTNTLSFVVYNISGPLYNPSGLMVNVSGSYTPIS
jgi:hypothetical protein